MDAAEEKQALQQIREKYGAYYTQQMDELHKTQAAEYLPEGEVFDEKPSFASTFTVYSRFSRFQFGTVTLLPPFPLSLPIPTLLEKQ